MEPGCALPALVAPAPAISQHILNAVRDVAAVAGAWDVGVGVFPCRYMSTQRLILPCPEATNGTVLFTIGEVLDTSRLAQNVLRGVGILLPPPPV